MVVSNLVLGLDGGQEVAAREYTNGSEMLQLGVTSYCCFSRANSPRNQLGSLVDELVEGVLL